MFVPVVDMIDIGVVQLLLTGLDSWANELPLLLFSELAAAESARFDVILLTGLEWRLLA